MEQPQPPPNDDDDNQDLDNRLNEIDIHEVEEEDVVQVDSDDDSIDSGEGSIVLVNEDEGRMEEIVEADDGVVLDDRNSDDMDTDDRNGEMAEMNGYVNEDRVGGNHPLIRFSAHTGNVSTLDSKLLANIPCGMSFNDLVGFSVRILVRYRSERWHTGGDWRRR